MDDKEGWRAHFEGAEVLEEQNGCKLYHEQGFFAVCAPGVEPGDADSYITGAREIAFEWLEQMAAG